MISMWCRITKVCCNFTHKPQYFLCASHDAFNQPTCIKRMTLQIVALVHSGICFCCFDNLLGLLSLHTAGQFKLLQHRLRTVLARIKPAGDLESLDEKTRQAIHEKVRECVLQHQELIWYSDKMEGIFMYTTLCQLLVSSVMICVAGFQMFLVGVHVAGQKKTIENSRNTVVLETHTLPSTVRSR